MEPQQLNGNGNGDKPKNDRFDWSAWKTPERSRKKGNRSIPFPLLRSLKVGTTVLRILDSRPVRCYQHFDGGTDFIVCDSQDCPLRQSQSGGRCQEFCFVWVLDRTDEMVKVWRYANKKLCEKLEALLRSEGDPRAYDVSITRTGLKRDTDYTVVKGKNTKPVQVDASQLFDLEKRFASLLEEGQRQDFQSGRGTTDGSGENRCTMPDDESVI